MVVGNLLWGPFSVPFLMLLNRLPGFPYAFFTSIHLLLGSFVLAYFSLKSSVVSKQSVVHIKIMIWCKNPS